MKPAAQPSNPELLLAQADWVRSLVRRLVADESRADDVLQSTWLAALLHPPRDVHSVSALRAWLAKVSRRFVFRAHRSDIRRADREQFSARRERLPSTAEIVEHESARRTIVEAVLALSEPYRSTLILSFYEELAPREIAKRQGVNGSTVRNRLKRGLELLRERFEHERGEQWRAWCIGVLPIAAATKAGGVTGGVIVGSKLKIGIAAALALLVCTIAWKEIAGTRATAGSETGAVVRELESGDERPDENAPSALDASATVATPRETVPTTEKDRSDTDGLSEANDPLGILVYGSVKDTSGKLAHADGLVQFIGEQGQQLFGRSSDASSYACTGLVEGRWRLLVGGNGYKRQERAIELSRTRPIERLDIVVERLQTLGVRFQTPDGLELSKQLPNMPRMDWRVSVTAVATRESPGANLPLTLQRNHGSYGIGTYRGAGSTNGGLTQEESGRWSGILELDEPLPAYVSAVVDTVVLETRVVQPGTEEVAFTLTGDQVAGALGGLHLRVVDAENDKPLAGGWAALNNLNYSESGKQLDESGEAHITQRPPGLYELDLRIEGYEHFEDVVEVEPGKLRDLGTYRLNPAVSIQGIVVDARDHPVTTRLRIFPRSESALGVPPLGIWEIGSDHEGKFRVGGLGRRDYVILVGAVPLLVNTRAGSRENLRIRMETGSDVVFMMPLVSPPDAMIEIATHDGLPAYRSNCAGEVLTLSLAPGAWRARVTHMGKLLAAKDFQVGSEKVVVKLGD